MKRIPSKRANTPKQPVDNRPARSAEELAKNPVHRSTDRYRRVA
jgi:hypothetical protein